MLRVRPGAAVTMIGWTLGVVDCGTEPFDAAGGALAAAGLLAGVAGLAGVVWEVAAGVLPPPPPHPAKAAQTRSRA